jgi:hypothetical protein
MKRLIALFLLIASTAIAGGETSGTLFFDDISDLLSQRQNLFDRVLADFDVFMIGSARVIDRSQSATLNGQRIGPYHFHLKPKGAADLYTYDLEIETNISFCDKSGHQVPSLQAPYIKEEISHIRIQPLPKNQYFEPTRDQLQDQREFERTIRERTSQSGRGF